MRVLSASSYGQRQSTCSNLSLFTPSLLLFLIASVTNGVSAHRMYARDEATFNWTALTPSTSLNWTTCYDTFQCARLAVPLRYSDPSGEQAVVALIKSPSNLSSTDASYRGPILFNPGGPGGSGIDTILSSASLISGVLGTQFDLIGFDPRGVGRTTPALSVFADSVEAGTFFVQQVLDLNSTESSLGTAFAQSVILGKLAIERAKDVAETVSTPTVARDMLSIVKATGQDKLQYWGFSYGSVLGATFAAMFPNNVGRLIIDGVEDSEAYYAGNRTGDLLDTDNVFTNILDACVEAGPSLCPIYENSTELVRSRVDTLLNKLRTDPVPLFNSSAINSAVVDYATTRDQIALALYSPYTLGADLMAALAALEQGNGSLIYAGSQPSTFHALLANECPTQTNEPFVAGLGETTLAIGCGDIVTDGAQSIDDVRAAYANISKVSADFGGKWLAGTLCSGWTIRADDRFNGMLGHSCVVRLFRAEYKFPIIAHWERCRAQKMSEGFANSVVLTQNSSGHTSVSATSTCTMQAVSAYFVNGTLPKAGTVCEVESTIFGSSNSSSNSTNGTTTSAVRIRDLGIEEATGEGESGLLKAARGLQMAGIVVKRNGVGRRFF